MITTILSALAAAVAFVFGLFGPWVGNTSCRALAKAYPEDTAFPGSADYLALNVYWANNTFHSPHCIFTPRDAVAAVHALRTLQTNKTPFAIRSGGHSMNPGVSSTSDGVVINLSKLNAITVDKARGTVTLGTGSRWGPVHRTLEEQGYAVAGGRGSSVGVGGFSLGGGFSFFLYRHGFSCDNIVAYEVVTAAGDVLAVSADSHPELFVALKGSGAPFVLVLSFTYKLIPLHDPTGLVYGGSISSGARSIPAVMQRLAEFASSGAEQDPDTHVLLYVLYMLNPENADAVTPIAFDYLFYPRPLESPPAALKPLFDAHNSELITSSLGNRKISSITDEVVAQGDGMRHTMLQWTIVDPTVDVVAEMERITREEVQALLRILPQAAVSLLLVPVTASTLAAGSKNVLGLEKGRNYLSIGYTGMLGSESDDPVFFEALRTAKRRCEDYLKRTGHWSPWVYLNYAWTEQDPIASYGAENVDLLRRVQSQYDPNRIWEKLVKGGFKIPKA